MVDIVEGNKLIAEFMGIRFNNGNAYDSNGNTYMRFRSWNNDMARNEFFRLNKLYHNSWDWLMPVVEKIGGVDNYSVNIHWGTGCTDSFAGCTIHSSTKQITHDELNSDEQSLIKAVWNSIIDFIQWYNENK